MPDLLLGFLDGVEDGHAEHVLAALAGRTPGHHLRPEVQHELGPGHALAPGDALHDYAFGFVDQYSHVIRPECPFMNETTEAQRRNQVL